MQERKLIFNRNPDPTIVVDENGEIAKKLNKIYQNMQLNLGFCYEQLVAGKLTEGMKDNHLYLSESYMVEFLETMNYDSVLKKQKDDRYIEIRSLNEENRELRNQLGEKISNEDIREKIKNMYNSFYEWWNNYGFGHISDSDLSFTQYKMTAKLSGHIFDSHTENGMSVDQKLEHFKNIGFDVDFDEEMIVASENNTNKLLLLLRSKYPSANILEIKTNYYKIPKYREILIEIRDFNDLV